MWIFAKESFVSIVVDKQIPGNVLVRGRIKGDVEALFPAAEVSKSLDRDYLYRTSVPKHAAALVISNKVLAIDYGNFKEASPKSRSTWLSRIWNIMYGVQEDESGEPGIFSRYQYWDYNKVHNVKSPKKGKKNRRAVDLLGNLKFPNENY